MKKKLLLLGLIVLSIFQQPSFSQNIEFARQHIQMLCSPDFHGRGYVQNGDRIAANYIAMELKRLSVKAFNENYFQEFTLNVNTFPSKLEVEVDGTMLQPGNDYIISPECGSARGTYKLARLTPEIIRNQQTLANFIKNVDKKTAIVLDTFGLQTKEYNELIDAIKNNQSAAGAVVELTATIAAFGVGRSVRTAPLIQIKRTSLNTSAKQIKLNIRNKYYEQYKTQNVIGYIEGETDSFIVFSAHYDHLGRMGSNTYFPGAHDNASGVATVLDLARHYTSQAQKPHYSIAFMLFSAEEAGLLGSKYYTRYPMFPLAKIAFLFNIDIVGSGDAGITVVNGSVYKNYFDLLCDINAKNNYLKEIKIRGAAANSDHYFFYENGVKCFFVYTMGTYKEYHNIFDTADAVPIPKYNEIFQLLTDFVKQYK